METTEPTPGAPREEIVFEDVSQISEFLRANMVPHSQTKRKELIKSLPTLTEEELAGLGKKNDSCPICLVPFAAILASEEIAMAMDSPAVAAEDLGVTRLAKTCGHVFCRKDISTWIRQNDSCPACRQLFITPDPTQVEDRTANPANGSLDEEDMFWRLFANAGLHVLPTGRPQRGSRGGSRIIDFNDDAAAPTRRDDRDDNETIGMYS